MRHNTYIYLLIFTTFFSCKERELTELTACFEINDNQPLIGDVVQFVNCSIGATNVEWNFGDNDDSNIRNPTHIFNEGKFLITQTIYNDLNESESVDRSISCQSLVIDSAVYFSNNIEENPYLLIRDKNPTITYFITDINKTHYGNNQYKLISNTSPTLPFGKLTVQFIPSLNHQGYSSTKVNFYNELDRENMEVILRNELNEVDLIIYLSRAEL